MENQPHPMTTTDPQDHAATDASPSQSLPPGWVGTTLGEVAEWGSGGTPQRTNDEYYTQNGIPWLTIGDLNDDLVTSAKTHITEEGLKNSSAKLVPAGTIFFAMYGSIGKMGISGMDCATNQAIAFCFPLQSVIKKSFLFYLLKSERENLFAQGQGGAQQNISQTILKAHAILLPPLPEQKRIADKLDTLLGRVETARERLERVPKLLKTFRQSVLSAAVSGELTREWRGGGEAEWEEDTFRLDKIGLIITGGTPKKELRGGQATIPFYKPTELDKGYRVETATELVSEAAAMSVRPIPDRTVMVTCIGATIGKVGLSRQAGITNQQINSIVCNEDVALPEYVYFLLSSDLGQSAIIDNASSTTLPILNKSRFSELSFPLPPLPEQAEIVRRVEALFALADRVEARYAAGLAAFDSLTPALLQKAFRGELVPQDPSDEPASVLLERIRAQRAAAGVGGGRRGRGAGKAKAGAGVEAQAAAPGRRGRPKKALTEAEAVAALEARRAAREAQFEAAPEGSRMPDLFGEG